MRFLIKVSLVAFAIWFLPYNSHSQNWRPENAIFNYTDSLIKSIYATLNNKDLSYEAFSYAYKGYAQVLADGKIEKTNILTVIDFNKSSKEDRFFIIDLKDKKIIHDSMVAHGKNSGWDIPKMFSNTVSSHQSSLGFYLTGNTYTGKHGLSLYLDGLEEGINDNARKRAIVIHQADYVSEQFVQKVGRLGRSFGCPSLPAEDYEKIISVIKDKSLIFIYSNQDEYFKKSDLL